MILSHFFSLPPHMCMCIYECVLIYMHTCVCVCVDGEKKYFKVYKELHHK